MNPSEIDYEKTLRSLLADLAKHGETLKLLKVETTAEGRQALAKRRHDVMAAMRTLNFTVEALSEGYKFDDGMAHAKTLAIARAVKLIQGEMDWLMGLISEGKP